MVFTGVTSVKDKDSVTRSLSQTSLRAMLGVKYKRRGNTDCERQLLHCHSARYRRARGEWMLYQGDTHDSLKGWVSESEMDPGIF